MPFRTCIHVKTNGLRCQSPALRHPVHCYNHHDHRRTLKRHNVIRTLKSARGRMAALQVVMDGVMNGRMNPEVARTLLYGIQMGTNMAANPFGKRTIAESPMFPGFSKRFLG